MPFRYQRDRQKAADLWFISPDRAASSDHALRQATHKLIVIRKLSGRLFRVLERTVNHNFERTSASLDQGHLRVGMLLRYKIKRRTGAWLIVSLNAVFDLNLHDLPRFLRFVFHPSSECHRGRLWQVPIRDSEAH